MKQILIAIPTARHIEPATFKSIYDLVIPPGYITTFKYYGTYQLDYTRNLIAMEARNYDYLFSVDSDMCFEADTLSKLLAHDKDIATGLYVKKTLDKLEYEIYHRTEGRFKSYTEINHSTLFEVDGCGFGCVLIKSSTFSNLEYPAFKNTWMDPTDIKMTEDLYFCRRARLQGYSIWADPTVRCGHLGIHTYK